MKYGPTLTLPPYTVKSHKMDISNLNLSMYSKKSTYRCIHFNGVVLPSTKIKKCSETNYESPCTCEKEPNFIKKNSLLKIAFLKRLLVEVLLVPLI